MDRNDFNAQDLCPDRGDFDEDNLTRMVLGLVGVTQLCLGGSDTSDDLVHKM
jgi:hypothetical protein